jgi:glycosyltransferase 2 family protein
MRTEKKLLLGAAALVLLGFVLYRSRGVLHLGEFSGGKLWAALRSANPLYILLGLVLIYGCYALRALRWQVFQKNLGKAQFWPIYRMTLAGFAAVFVLGRAGEPVRPLLLSRKSKIPVADTFGIYVLERLFDFASSAVIAALGLLLYSSQEHVGGASSTITKGARTAGGLLAAGVAGTVAVLVYLRLHGTGMLERKLQGWLAAQGWRAAVARIILGFTRGIQTIRTWRDLVEAVFLSIVHWYFVALVYLFVSHGFGGRMALLSVGDCLLLLAITLMGSILQLPAVGGGAQALAIFAYTQVFGVEKEAAVAAALVLWLVTFASCSIVGVPLLIREGFSFGQLREMAEQEKEELAEEAKRGAPEKSRRGDADN